MDPTHLRTFPCPKRCPSPSRSPRRRTTQRPTATPSTKTNANSRLEGRLEFHPGEPDLVLDGAHTQESVQQLVRVLKERWNSGVLVVAFNNDKKILEIAQTLSSLGWPLVVTQSPHPKALEAERLAQVFKGQVWVEPDFQEAYRKALALCPIQGVVVAAGSFFLVGALRAALGLC